MRALLTHQAAPVPAVSEPETAHEHLIATVDAALAFASSRELFTNADVVGLFAMLDTALADNPRVDDVRAVLAHAEVALEGRAVVSSGELVDRLLDARIRAAGVPSAP